MFCCISIVLYKVSIYGQQDKSSLSYITWASRGVFRSETQNDILRYFVSGIYLSIVWFPIYRVIRYQFFNLPSIMYPLYWKAMHTLMFQHSPPALDVDPSKGFSESSSWHPRSWDIWLNWNDVKRKRKCTNQENSHTHSHTQLDSSYSHCY